MNVLLNIKQNIQIMGLLDLGRVSTKVVLAEARF